MPINVIAAGSSSSTNRDSYIPYDPSTDGVYILAWSFKEYGGGVDIAVHHNIGTTAVRLAAAGNVSNCNYSYATLDGWPTSPALAGSTWYIYQNNAGPHMTRLYEVNGVRNWLPVDKSQYNGAYAGSQVQTTIALNGTTGCYQFCFYTFSKDLAGTPDSDSTVIESGSYDQSGAHIAWSAAYKPVEADSDAMLWTYSRQEYPQVLSIVLAPEDNFFPLQYYVFKTAGWGDRALKSVTYPASTHMEDVAIVAYMTHYTNNVSSWDIYFDADTTKQITQLGTLYAGSTYMHSIVGFDKDNLSSAGGTMYFQANAAAGSWTIAGFYVIGGVDTITDDTDHVLQWGGLNSTSLTWPFPDMQESERSLTWLANERGVGGWLNQVTPPSARILDTAGYQHTGFSGYGGIMLDITQDSDGTHAVTQPTSNAHASIQSVVITPVAGVIEQAVAGVLEFLGASSKTFIFGRSTVEGTLTSAGALVRGWIRPFVEVLGTMGFSSSIVKIPKINVEGILTSVGLGRVYKHFKNIYGYLNFKGTFLGDIYYRIKASIVLAISPEVDIDAVVAPATSDITHRAYIEVSGMRASTL